MVIGVPGVGGVAPQEEAKSASTLPGAAPSSGVRCSVVLEDRDTGWLLSERSVDVLWRLDLMPGDLRE